MIEWISCCWLWWHISSYNWFTLLQSLLGSQYFFIRNPWCWCEFSALTKYLAGLFAFCTQIQGNLLIKIQLFYDSMWYLRREDCWQGIWRLIYLDVFSDQSWILWSSGVFLLKPPLGSGRVYKWCWAVWLHFVWMLSHIEPHGHISKQIPQTWWTRSGSWSWTRSWDQVQVLDQVLDLDPSPLLHFVLGWAWSGPVLGFALGHFWFVMHSVFVIAWRSSE